MMTDETGNGLKKAGSLDVSPIQEVLLRELEWLAAVLRSRLSAFAEGREAAEEAAAGAPELEGDTPYGELVRQWRLSPAERLVLILAMAAHVVPHFLDEVIRQELKTAGDFPQIGGVRGQQFRGFLPSGETALFLLSGGDLARRFHFQDIFGPDHLFARRRVLWLEEPPAGEPLMSGKIVFSQDFLELITAGKMSRPRFSLSFPAQLIDTPLEWNDLVLNARTLREIRELENWVRHGRTLMQDWGMARRLKPGFRALFHGPPGTGKTLTASLLGKYTGKDVYKIDLSMVVSKYIGETEKNLSNLFAKAENKDWILFFDEADALFGKRTNVRDAHDRYANQEVAYLLQRVEDYDGLVILASNLKSNIDEAFMRRFQSIIHFPMPRPAERLLIWQKGFPARVRLAPGVDLERIAQQYEISGSNIMNVVQYACLQALAADTDTIDLELLAEGIRKEYAKEGRTL